LVEQVARMRELKIAYRVLVGHPERKRIIGRQKRKFFDSLECQAVLISSLPTDVSGQPICPIFAGQAVQEERSLGKQHYNKSCRNRVGGGEGSLDCLH
jgi:hypothetical protein